MGCCASKSHFPKPDPPIAVSPIATAPQQPSRPQENPQEGKGVRIDPPEKPKEPPKVLVLEEEKKPEIGKQQEVIGEKVEERPGLLVVDLHNCYLSGKWCILRNAVSEEINTELNRLIEEGFHTGIPVSSFSYASGECSMDYGKGEITFLHPEENKVFSISRKVSDFAELLWTGEDGIERPFPPEVESLILSHPADPVQFQLDSRLFQASLTSLSLLDTTTSRSFPMQRL